MIVMILKYQDEEFDIRHIFLVLILLTCGSVQENGILQLIGGMIVGSVSAFALSTGKDEVEFDLDEYNRRN